MFPVLNAVDNTYQDRLHFVMRVLKKGNRNTQSLAYTSLVHPVLEYGAAWGPCRGQINALDQLQMKAAQFNYHTKDSDL